MDALSADESLLLVRELPHLSRLMDGNLAGIGPDVARQLTVRVLKVAQGHPQLLDLADGQAAHPQRLRKLADAADAALAGDRRPAGRVLHHRGDTGGEPDYLLVFAAWTRAAAATLAPADRDLFCLLCCLEEADRIRPVLEINWTHLRRLLGRAGGPPELDSGLTRLAAAGLVVIQPGTPQAAEEYPIHSAIAAAGRDLAGHRFQEAADTALAAYWTSLANHARDREDAAADQRDGNPRQS